jgi:hypothetical protein
MAMLSILTVTFKFNAPTKTVFSVSIYAYYEHEKGRISLLQYSAIAIFPNVTIKIEGEPSYMLQLNAILFICSFNQVFALSTSMPWILLR